MFCFTDPADAFRSGLINAGVNSFASYGAERIGSAYGADTIDPITHKILHGIVGGIRGQILHQDALSGAVGAVAAEILGEMLVEDAGKRIPELHVDAMAKGKPIDRAAIEKQYQDEVTDRLNIARLGAAGIALVANQKVDVARNAANRDLSALKISKLWEFKNSVRG